jgi:regulatory protein YycI of two-component signal transduction system YycFG
MKKIVKIILILVLLLLLVFLAFYFVNKNVEPEINVDLGEEKTEEENQEPIAKKSFLPVDEEVLSSNEIYEEAEENSDVKICLKIENESYKDLCIKNIAILNKSILDCSGIGDDITKQDCEDYIKHKLAQESGEVLSCLEISDDRLAWSCVSSLVETREDCSLLPSDFESDCLDMVSMRNLDCENISSSELKQECQTIPN